MHKHKRHMRGKFRFNLPIKIIIGVVLLIIIIIIIPSGTSTSSNADISSIRSRGVIRVALSDDYNSFADENDQGIEVELANLIASKIFSDSDSKTRIEIVRMNPAFMGTHFSDASIDIAIMQCPNGLYPSKYAYSEPYYTDSCLLIIKRENDAYSSLNGMNIGVIKNSICDVRLTSYSEKNNVTITSVKYTTYEIMLNALKADKIDACVMTGTDYKKYGAGNLRAHSVELSSIGYSVVANSENSGIMQVVNQAIVELKNTKD